MLCNDDNKKVKTKIILTLTERRLLVPLIPQFDDDDDGDDGP